MNQIAIGKYITRKRKEKGLTQEQLAEKLGVSNKTISKWETGKCMPDYSTISTLCKELDITTAELLDGEDRKEDEKNDYNENQILELLKRVQHLEYKRELEQWSFWWLLGFVIINVNDTASEIGVVWFIELLMKISGLVMIAVSSFKSISITKKWQESKGQDNM